MGPKSIKYMGVTDRQKLKAVKNIIENWNDGPGRWGKPEDKEDIFVKYPAFYAASKRKRKGRPNVRLLLIDAVSDTRDGDLAIAGEFIKKIRQLSEKELDKMIEAWKRAYPELEQKKENTRRASKVIPKKRRNSGKKKAGKRESNPGRRPPTKMARFVEGYEAKEIAKRPTTKMLSDSTQR